MVNFVDNGVTILINNIEVDRGVFLEMEPEYASPVGVLTYVQGVRYTVQSDGNQTGHNGPWPDGDVYISKLQQYLDEIELRNPEVIQTDYSDNQAAVTTFEATLPAVDPSDIIKKQYLGLSIHEHVAKTGNKIIGVIIADMHGQGALAMLDVLIEDCNNYGIPLFGILSPYNGTSPDALLTSVVSKGFVSSGDVGPNMTHIYKLADDTLELAKFRALASVRTEHAKHLNDLTGNATIEERDTWAVQLSAAVAFLADGNAEDQLFLEGLLTDAEIAAGATAATMADKIIAKSEQTKLLIRMAGKMKREADQAIAAASTLEELETIIAALKAQEATTLAAFLASMNS